MPSEISVSSSWFPRLDCNLEKAFSFLVSNGLYAVELNPLVHPLDARLVTELLEKYGIKVTSIHNICSCYPVPFDPDDPYGDELASLDESARRRSVEQLAATAETARKLGARAVVVHGGYVERTKKDLRYKLLLRAIKRNSLNGTVKKLAAHLYEERRKYAQPHLEQLIRSLREICTRYEDLMFGLETRYHLHSIPDLEEVDLLIREVGCPNLGYWHDYGHAQVLENLGLFPHREWLKRYRDRIIGVHLHAVEFPFHDHLAGTPGHIDLEMLRALLPRSCIKVVEASPENGPDNLVKFIRKLESF